MIRGAGKDGCQAVTAEERSTYGAVSPALKMPVFPSAEDGAQSFALKAAPATVPGPVQAASQSYSEAAAATVPGPIQTASQSFASEAAAAVLIETLRTVSVSHRAAQWRHLPPAILSFRAADWKKKGHQS